MKQCRVCKTTKPLTEFHRQARSKDGHQSRCKDCACRLAAQWYAANRDRALAQQREHYQSNREDVLVRQRAYYAANREKWDEYARRPEVVARRNARVREAMQDPARREAKKASDRESYRRHADERKASVRAYAKAKKDSGDPAYRAKRLAATRRRRAREGAAEIKELAPREWRRLIERQHGECFYCRQAATLTADHLIPIARGGRHAIGNLVAACQPCNSAKRDLLPVEFRTGRSHGGPVPISRAA